jgi:ribose-phosphate pyrophosphokinase
MQTLDLIDNSNSDIKYELIDFPDSQPHIRLIQESINTEACTIISRFSNPADYFRIAFAADALRRCGVNSLDLNISYLMGARMDRVMIDGEALSIKVIAEIINILDFRLIRVFDPHSDVSCAVINHCAPISNIELVKKSISHYRLHYKFEGEITLISPDAGAMKKTGKIGAGLGINDIVECSKKRNLVDGKLSGFKINASSLQNKVCFITDDICDGGGTFTGVADELKKLGASKVVLVVSHGIFSKGYLIKNVDQVYTTNSYKELTNIPDNLTVFKIKEIW